MSVVPDFDSLYTLYNGQIRAMLWKRGCREPLDDVMQDFWLRVWRNLETTFDPDRSRERNLERWLCTVALNAWRMNYRAESSWRRRAVLVNPVHAFPSDLIFRLLIAIGQLPAQQRYVLLGRIKGYTCEEIAGLMGVQTDTVAQLSYRARCALKSRGW